MLKLKFDSKQQYQLDAVDAIVDIFKGQQQKQSLFTARKHSGAQMDVLGKMTELGYGNKLDLSPDELLENVIKVQDKYRLPRSKKLKDELYDVPNFAIEMETGTGKTYVYTRTALELRAKYGFAKFIIVVPGVAIREGVQKSLDITKSHFAELYPNEPFDSFVYDSSHLDKVRDFATSETTQVMIINIDAFRKSFSDKGSGSALRIHQVIDGMEGRKPIEFIQQTNPIVIIDEPQSVDNTDKAKEAIKSLNPLCILRYSATHRDTYNLMYRLGPVEAYEQGLVKGIEVLAMSGGEKERHIKLLSVKEKPSYTAELELKVVSKTGGFEKKKIKVNPGNRRDLEALTKNPVYAGLFVANISTQPGREFVEFDNSDFVQLAAGTTETANITAQIRATIERHLDREMQLLEQNIKVLSLFFLDKVGNYREYTEKGPALGPYAKIFEEQYLELIKLPKYNTLFNNEEVKKYFLNEDVQQVHDGYFAMDKGKKGSANAGEMVFVESKGEGSALKDESAYDLIMKDKERLLSTDTSLRFIFSHSALKEGWDNPNVFQICTLVENNDTMTKRQKVGRGLRLPVYSSGPNQGERVRDEQLNILTVIANESYTEFADTLQREIEGETNTKFGVIDARLFEHILYQPTEGADPEPLGYDRAEEIVDYLKKQEMLDRQGKATTVLKEKVVKDEVSLPEKYETLAKDIIAGIKSATKRLPIKNHAGKVDILSNKKVILSPEFSDLWDKIKHKTKYHVSIDVPKLVEESAQEISKMSSIKPRKITAELVDVSIKQSGVEVGKTKLTRTYDSSQINEVPDLLAHIQNYTKLKRRTIADILVQSETLESVRNNSEQYLTQVVEVINRHKRHMLVDGIKYTKIDGEFYEQTQFESDELTGYLKQDALPVSKSTHTHVKYDSDVEKSFAEHLEQDSDVKVYAKLPGWFTVPTPLGNYNPDWAVVLEQNGVEKLYFIIETKGSTLIDDLRFNEDAKIRCGQQHFKSLDNDVKYELADSYDVWRKKV